MRYRTKLSLAVMVMIAVAFVLAMLGLIGFSASAQPVSPVYVCSDITACVNNQALEIFDHNGAPIFSVGLFGGAGVFGDNFKIFPPNTVFNPAITESYTAPTGTCVSPAIWLSPQGLWKCATGHWRLVFNLGN